MTTLNTRALPLIEVAGSHREIGRQFGEQLRESIKAYSSMWLTKAAQRSGLGRDTLLEKVTGFKQLIDDYAPHLGEEIRGVAEGAGIEEREAFSIQVRMELLFAGPPPPSCTTFALAGERTTTGETIVGQNVDLDADVEQFGVILKVQPDDGPAVLMYTSTGLISYVGINQAGLAVHGNLLVSEGWRTGFPRYLITRLMLSESTVDAGLATGLYPPRASSRNMILGDANGTIANAELSVDDARVQCKNDGTLVHTNHYVEPGLCGTDAYIPESSKHRHNRISELMANADHPLSIEELKGFFRDHDGFPGSICAHVTENSSSKTVASLISEPAAGKMHATWGSPCEQEYVTYTF